jgi:hypothetical protein
LRRPSPIVGRGGTGDRLDATESCAPTGGFAEPVGYRGTINWDLRHPKSALVIRLLLAVWIAVVVVVLCATGRWWGLVFLVPLALDGYLIRRILTAAPAR